MKKVAMLVVAVLCVLGSVAANAESVEGKVSAEAYGGLGISYPGGKAPVGFDAKTALAYNFGLQGAYGLTSALQIIGGAEYAYKPLALKSSDYDTTITFKPQYVDILAGARFFFFDGGFYGDAGLFYGIKAGDAKYTYEEQGVSESGKVKDLEDSTLNNDFGFFLGLGYIIPVTENLSLDLGCRAQYGLVEAIKLANFKLNTRDIAANLGVIYTF